MANKADGLQGTQRAAILLMSLGEQDAANLLKQLDANDVQRLGIAMTELQDVSRDQMTSVLQNFIGVVDGKAEFASSSQDYVRRVLTQAVGKQKADLLLDRVSGGQAGQGIEALKWMEAKAVAQIISGEHPQIAALVLSYLEAEQGAEMVVAFAAEDLPLGDAEAVHRLARKINAAAVQDVAAHVLPEIRQLQGGASPVGQLLALFVAVSA